MEKYGQFHLLSIVGKNYEPKYSIEFKNTGDVKQKVDVVLFNSIIEFKSIILLSIVTFYGSVEKIRDNMLLGHFHKSELLSEYVLDSSKFFELDALRKVESQKHEETLIKMGLNVL